MKIILLLPVALLLTICAGAQNIGIGTETPQGKLHIKGSADTSQLVIDASATQSVAHPVILLRTSVGDELLRIHGDERRNLFIGYKAGLVNLIASSANDNVFIGSSAGVVNSTGFQNTVLGSNALRSNISGANNVAIGYQSLTSNTDGFMNTAVGTQSLIFNTTGSQNTALGTYALGSNTSGANNVAIGYQSLANNIDGIANTAVGTQSLTSNTTGILNTALGFYALRNNTSGSNNVAIGYQSLIKNTDGYYNTAIGTQSLISNTTGSQNTALGFNTLINNMTGNFNTTVGYQSMVSTNTGANNTALGAGAMFLNFGGSYNTGIGQGTLSNTTNAQYNTALGYNAGGSFDNGYNNVFLGANTDVNRAGYFNVIAIGQSTICTASSQVTIGNGATNSYRAYANWSNISDGRFKKNIRENVPGLDFITQLHPVTYNLDATALDDYLHSNADKSVVTNTRTAADLQHNITAKAADASSAAYVKALKEKETEVTTGFVAQDVETTARQLGFTFSGVDAPKTAGDVYGLRYAEFVVPLVKAVQEQQQLIKDLQKQIDALKVLIKK